MTVSANSQSAVVPCTTRFPISECPNMKAVEGDTSMSHEHYACAVCGRRESLDYEEMK